MTVANPITKQCTWKDNYIVLMSTYECGLKHIEKHFNSPFELTVSSTVLAIPKMGKKIKRRHSKINTLVLDLGSSQCACGNGFPVVKLHGKESKLEWT